MICKMYDQMRCISRDSKGFLSHLIKHAQLQGSVKFPAKISTGSPISILHKTFSTVHSHHIDIIYFRQLIRFAISKLDASCLLTFRAVWSLIFIRFLLLMRTEIYSTVDKSLFDGTKMSIFQLILYEGWPFFPTSNSILEHKTKWYIITLRNS